jgi:outer membrane protein assembly factor BamB
VTPKPAGSAADAWTTYGRTAARTGDDPTSAAFQSIKQAWQSPQLDGDIYAQPLLANGHVYIVTENDTFYSLDAGSGKIQWQQHVAMPVPRSLLPCGDIDPTGITGTPVIDPASGILFAVAFEQPGKHELYAVDIATGAIRYHVPIDPSGANPIVQQQRSALALGNGTVYVAFGGLDGDCGQYHGWVVAAAARNGSTQATYQVPTQREGAIWAPAGPAMDSAGNLYVATGNGSSTTTFDYGDSVIKLSPDLKVLDWFAPTDWAQLNRTDLDLGSISPLLLPNGLVFQIGKAGEGYLLRADHLGEIGGQAYAAPVCTGGSAAFGSTAFSAPYIYVPCRNGMVALKLGSGASFSTAWTGTTAAPDSPVVAGGVVWAVDPAGRTLVGLDAVTGKPRFQASLPPTSGGLPHFIAPTVAAGSVYIAAGRVVAAAR